MGEHISSEDMKESIVMALRGDNLVYLADGESEKMEKVKESFSKILMVPVLIGELTSDMNVRELRENTLKLTETFKYLIDLGE